MAKASKSERKANDLVKRRLFHARSYWDSQNAMYPRLMDFCLDIGHYKRGDSLSRDASRQQPKTQRQFSLIRHKKSLLLRQMPQFDTHAVQPGADAHAAEVSRRVIENVFYDPLKGYHDIRDRFVTSALAGGRGCVAIEWHQKWGPCFRFVDPRRLHITPGHTFLHSVFNPCVLEEVPMRLSEVRAMSMWDVPKDLEGDGGDNLESQGMSNREADGLERDQAQHWPSADEDEASDPIVTICKAWFREDPFSDKKPRKLRDATLPPEEWVFVDDSVGITIPFDPTNPVPPISEVTGQPLRLVTSKNEMYSAGDDYDDGYLVITAPFYQGDKPLFEGGWVEGAINEDAKLSTFPYMELVGYRHPLRRTGISDTELTHSLTIVDNASFRATYEQMHQAGGILVAMKGKLEDSEGKPFRFPSAGGPMPVAWATDPLGLQGVNFFQAAGMNPAMPNFRAMIESQWQHIGTGDFAGQLGPERSKDIAVGTANLLQQTGDLPVQLHGQDLALQEAIGARVVLDLCRAYMGDNVVSWVEDEGIDAYATVRGSDLVPLNVTVRADEEWRQQDVDKVQAQAQFLGMLLPLQLPPNVIAALLKEAGFSGKAIGALSEAMQMQQQQGMAGPPGVPAGSGPPALNVVEGGVPQ